MEREAFSTIREGKPEMAMALKPTDLHYLTGLSIEVINILRGKAMDEPLGNCENSNLIADLHVPNASSPTEASDYEWSLRRVEGAGQGMRSGGPVRLSGIQPGLRRNSACVQTAA